MLPIKTGNCMSFTSRLELECPFREFEVFVFFGSFSVYHVFPFPPLIVFTTVHLQL